MKIIRSVQEMQHRMQNARKQKEIGFVPTMGYLHEGHLKLMEESTKENDLTVASIFVNPLQFGPEEDFDRYPRNEERDITLAEQAGADMLFIPEVQDMYPNQLSIAVSITKRTDRLCGSSRPGHFDGVGTVLTKLFHIINPTRVYFGLKDAQQVAVVDALINDFNFPVELVAIPTVREPDGLAKSSRNANLTAQERQEAVWLSKALATGRKMVVDGQKNPAIIVKEVTELIQKHTSGKIDYVEILCYPELEPINDINQRVILALAVQFTGARLIDNVLFDEAGNLISTYR